MRTLRFVVAAACYVFVATCAHTFLYADENTPAAPLASKDVKPPEVTSPPATETPLAPLMSVLGPIGLAKPLTKAGINIYGYVESGYMTDFTAQRKGPTFLGYDNLKNNLLMDKVSLNIERMVDPTKKQFDMGFHVEGIYGADAKYIHSNGLMDKQTGRYQWDLLQAYVDMALPYVPMKLRVGKWIELAGFEQFSANIYGAFGDPMRALYSYSYQFLYAEPGTQTGALLTYVLNPKWTFDAGTTAGWNQSVWDSHHSPDFLGRVTYTPSDKTSVIFVMTEGPEFPIAVGRNLPSADNSHMWTALDLVVTQKINDKLSLGLGSDFVETPRIPGYTGGAKKWGGVAGYGSYAFDPHVTLNTRLEWYTDSAQGFSTGAPVSTTFYETTWGVAIKPFPKNNTLSHLIIRPEIRYDFSDRPVFNNKDRNQLTFSTDMLYTF